MMDMVIFIRRFIKKIFKFEFVIIINNISQKIVYLCLYFVGKVYGRVILILNLDHLKFLLSQQMVDF